MSLGQITNGQDSFLDIVANLVGVLIILVVVVGAQATSSWKKVEPSQELIGKSDELQLELSRTSDVVLKLHKDNQQLENQIAKESMLTADLAQQRHEMLMQLAVVKREMTKEREARAAALKKRYDSNDQKLAENVALQQDFQSEKRRLENQMIGLTRELNAVSAQSQPETEIINHLPSPIAKTVFAQEIHFHLSQGRLTYVPMEELIAKMKSEWKVKAEKLKQTYETVESVGPIGSFRMQYELISEDHREKTKFGDVTHKRVSFRRFKLFPIKQHLGESIDEALTQSGSSEFQKVLSRFEPRKTTVSIWVYPDSYDHHGQLKEWLHRNGFQMASWPLDHGKQISGGPNGFKTSAQ
jgi:hypothetical protein